MEYDESLEDQPSCERTELPPIEIAPEALSPDALTGVIDNFITREGTDYGATEVGYDSKLQSLRKQISRGDVKIIFDPNTETVTLVTKHQFNTMMASQV